MPRSRRESEREIYDRLHAKYGGRVRRRHDEDLDDEDDEDLDDEDDGQIIVMAGRRGEQFLDRMFGGGRRRAAREPDDEDDEPDDEDEPVDEDPPAPRGPRFFQGRGR